MDNLDLESLLISLEDHAMKHHDGHVTLMRFTTHWKIMWGTPQIELGYGHEEVAKLPAYGRLKAALFAILQGE